MTVEYIRYRVTAERQAAFVAAYRQAAESLRASEFCLGFDLAQCEEEPERFILRIRWTSTQDHMTGFRTSPQFRTFFQLVRPFVGDIEEMQHYEPLLSDAEGT